MNWNHPYIMNKQAFLGPMGKSILLGGGVGGLGAAIHDEYRPNPIMNILQGMGYGAMAHGASLASPNLSARMFVGAGTGGLVDMIASGGRNPLTGMGTGAVAYPLAINYLRPGADFVRRTLDPFRYEVSGGYY
jgi:hypothetical protein